MRERNEIENEIEGESSDLRWYGPSGDDLLRIAIEVLLDIRDIVRKEPANG